MLISILLNIDEEQYINVAVSKWNELFTNVADLLTPIKKLRTKGIQTPWLTTDLSNAMQDRDYHHRKLRARPLSQIRPFIGRCTRRLNL
jgi:hypothetical protein